MNQIEGAKKKKSIVLCCFQYIKNLIHLELIWFCLKSLFLLRLVLFWFLGLRAEEFMYQKLDKPKPPRFTENETLGHTMIDAGNDFGPGTNYGRE